MLNVFQLYRGGRGKSRVSRARRLSEARLLSFSVRHAMRELRGYDIVCIVCKCALIVPELHHLCTKHRRANLYDDVSLSADITIEVCV